MEFVVLMFMGLCIVVLLKQIADKSGDNNRGEGK